MTTISYSSILIMVILTIVGHHWSVLMISGHLKLYNIMTYYINQFNKCQHFETDISDLRTCRPI